MCTTNNGEDEKKKKHKHKKMIFEFDDDELFTKYLEEKNKPKV